ncbi:hypothetical protein ACN27G_27500 [Plantactinospora sp. WMMB334]|uniref:hypothetical protein n=1 Tax=Plantactinospora sp. WMMB334 TaxID=3404119 RepID=UPI003B94A57F
MEIRLQGSRTEVARLVERVRVVFDVVSVSRTYRNNRADDRDSVRVYVHVNPPPVAPPALNETERPADRGELCVCGRPAVKVFLGGPFGPTGYCGMPDGGQRGPCRFCGGERHQAARCSRYVLRPDGDGEVRP